MKLEILGVCEHRWADWGEYKATLGNENFTFLFSGKPLSENRESGVGLILSATSRRALMDWSPVSDRILIARFRTRARNVSIVQVYSPTELADEDTKDSFYELLSATLNKLPRGDIQILMGDLNAKVGSDNTNRETIMGKHGTGTANDNGERFAELCTSHDLVIGGTIFNHKNIHKLTWYSNDGVTVNQIDHISISRKWRQSLLDVRVYRGAEVHTDHKLLVGTIKIKLAALRPRFENNTRKVDPSKLPLKVNAFKAELQRQLGDSRPSEPEQRWNHLKASYTSASEKIIPLVPERRKCYISDATWNLIEQRKCANLALNAATSQNERLEALRIYNSIERRVKTSVRNDRRVWLNSLADRAQEAANHNQSRELYRLTKHLAGKAPPLEKPIKADDGSLITNVDLQVEYWTEHFRSVLNPPVSSSSSHTVLPNLRLQISQPTKISDSKPSLTEVKAAIQEMKSGKAPGPDGLLIELYKADLETATRELHPIITAFWETGSIPESWKEALLIKLPKKGNLSLCANWRGIALQNSINKIIARIVLGRISSIQDCALRREQAGFRRGRSCTDHINTLRIIVEQCKELNSRLCLLFVDFKCAFDRVDQKRMWEVLPQYGIPAKLVGIIKELYRDANLKIVHRGKIGPEIKVGSGVKQGCILSPLLFNIVLDYTMRLAKSKTASKSMGIHWNTFNRLTDLDYADDIVCLSETMSDMKTFLDNLVTCANDVGLKINVGKTKLMRMNQPMSTRSSVQGLHIDGEVIEEVDKFVYLGSIISKDGGADDDVLNRIRLANLAFGSLRHIWTSKRLSRRLKMKIFNSNVKSVLLYGCETWKVTKKITQRLQVFVNRCLRKICGIYYPELISNARLYALTKQEPIADDIGKRKWGWIGHTLRKDPADITRQAVFWNPPGRRNPGRPSTTWQSSIRKEAAQQGRNINELAALASNRIRFKSFVDALHFTVE